MQTQDKPHPPSRFIFAPSWHALPALVAVEVIELLLSDQLSLKYLLASSTDTSLFELIISAVLFALAMWTWALGNRTWAHWTTLAFAAWVTLGLALDVTSLVVTMPARMGETEGIRVLSDAVLVWTANVLVFAVWYWLLEREIPLEKPRDFAFPQQINQLPGWEAWRPGFLDYLFLAFNTSTAFSPTDTLILSWRVKMLTMIQAAFSLVILAVLAAFGVNTLAN